MDKAEKDAIKVAVLGAVFVPEATRLKKLLGAIQDRHALTHGCRAFMLDGKPVINGDAAAAKVKNKAYLEEGLRDEARFLILQQTKLNIDSQRVLNFLGTLEPHCHTLQDYRDVLPNLVVEAMDHNEIKALSRTREQGYVFASPPIGSPTKQKMFMGAVDIMFSYLVNRLVF